VPEVLVVAPMELVKIRIQLTEQTVEMNEFKRTWTTAKDLG
jgi:hypothetical protein